MSISKDPKVQDLRLEQKQLQLSANLVAASSEAPSLVSIDNSTIASTVIEVDVKEAVSSVQKVQIVNKATGEPVAIAAAPVVTHTLENGSTKLSSSYVAADGKIVSSSISVTCNGSGLSNACIEVSFR